MSRRRSRSRPRWPRPASARRPRRSFDKAWHLAPHAYTRLLDTNHGRRCSAAAQLGAGSRFQEPERDSPIACRAPQLISPRGRLRPFCVTRFRRISLCVRIHRRESSFGLFGVAPRDAPPETDEYGRLLREGSTDRRQGRVILHRHKITDLLQGSVGAREGRVRHFVTRRTPQSREWAPLPVARFSASMLES